MAGLKLKGEKNHRLHMAGLYLKLKGEKKWLACQLKGEAAHGWPVPEA